MKKILIVQLVLACVLAIGLGGSALGQIHPNPVFMFCFDDATTFNGQPVPVGSIIKAYDQSGVLCGMDTVHTAGNYGSMAVYGDDTGPGSTIDEGCDPGEAVVFEINDRPATVEAGDNSFENQGTRQIQLAAGSTIGITAVDMPEDKLGTFNSIVRFEVGVRNDGNGTDFYGVTAVNSHTGFTTLAQTDTVYAEAGETVYVPFDIQTPIWPGDTVNTITFTVYSILDPTQEISGTVDLIFTITDVDDDIDNLVPGAFTLGQNYPNPFNPATIIPYSLPSASTVRMDVFDILGRTVDSRDFGSLPAGDHEIHYDASDLPSGVYFYRIATETAVDSRKMILVK